ncbi:TPA: hypothetical protein ACKP89_001128 [Stenotrophomonas maltophilia]|jgi:hypothetical protein|uniref:hypothetical protein n=1 Tax=Stenotrophomonas maltophilia TaxID=40324 RepID=UPI000C1488B5|nr:hypothetical protein [Stenotrophomonas maltophilia]MBA0235879.1 hypothetical protein [Stenotrophomonas maltophilia]MBA0270629.1 hypothetical protein [Stenotrophomonas maltophilia]MBA0331895.1 hypothetical protein [Stenotrophomonas maltophilia]MBN5121986.1 hypothetical protein [Stenotrophomonas maltophilia]MBO3005454.1 hypothetical protein [Stenotrophomonas maltophilia]
MRPVIYGAALLAALSATIASCHEPKAGFELRTFPKVSDAEYSVMREEAVRLARGGVVQEARHPSDRYFVVICRGVPAMLVDNSLEQLLIVLYAGRDIDAPCVESLMSHWSWRIVTERARV